MWKQLIFLTLFGLAASQLSFQSNVSLSNKDEFTFRAISTNEFSVPPFYSGVYLSSLSVDLSKGSATVDGLYGAAYTGLAEIGSPPIPPSAYLSFFESSTTWRVNGNDYANVSSGNAAAFIGKTFISLDEVSNGNVVSSLPLNTLLWSIEERNLGAGGLRYAVFRGIKPLEILNPSFIIRVTFAFSDVVGVLNVVGSGLITPKSMESIVKITNWPYAAATNSLRLNLGIGSAQASLQVDGEVQTLAGGSGRNGVWFSLDQKSSADGQVAPVEISGFAQGSTDVNFGNSLLAGQVRAKYGASASFKLVSVTFRPGAREIIYDPTIGAGSNPPESSSGMIAPGMFLVALIAKLLFF